MRPFHNKTRFQKLLKECTFCGNTFTTNRESKKFCSERCINQNKRKILIENGLIKKYERFCQNCNKPFVTTNSSVRYCSRRCAYLFQKNKKNYEKGRGFISLRFKIFKRDNFTCKYCGRNQIKDNIKILADHIIPVSKNGKTDEDNLITSCEECNLGKSDVLLEEHQNKIYRDYCLEANKNPALSLETAKDETMEDISDE